MPCSVRVSEAPTGPRPTILSWALVNTVFALKYARGYYSGGDGGIDFGQREPPAYSDFAYLAFTVGMCYQVSDQSIRTRRLRRTVLIHSIVSYAFGVVIIASTINVLAGFIHA